MATSNLLVGHFCLCPALPLVLCHWCPSRLSNWMLHITLPVWGANKRLIGLSMEKLDSACRNCASLLGVLHWDPAAATCRWQVQHVGSRPCTACRLSQGAARLSYVTKKVIPLLSCAVCASGCSCVCLPSTRRMVTPSWTPWAFPTLCGRSWCGRSWSTA